MELFWISLDNAPSSIVFYLEIKMEVEVGVHDIRSRFTPRFQLTIINMDTIKETYATIFWKSLKFALGTE